MKRLAILVLVFRVLVACDDAEPLAQKEPAAPPRAVTPAPEPMPAVTPEPVPAAAPAPPKIENKAQTPSPDRRRAAPQRASGTKSERLALPPAFTRRPSIEAGRHYGRGETLAIRFSARRATEIDVALDVEGTKLPLVEMKGGVYGHTLDGSEPEGTGFIVITLANEAGASIRDRIGPVVVDFTPPVLSAAVSPAIAQLRERLVVRVTADETLAGSPTLTSALGFEGPRQDGDAWVFTHVVQADEVGSDTVRISAKDRGGNTTTAPLEVIVQYDGTKVREAQALALEHEQMAQKVGGEAALSAAAPIDDLGQTPSDVKPATTSAVTREPSNGPKPIRIAIYNMSGEAFEADQTSLLTASLVAEVRKLERVAAVSMSEVASMLSVEEQRQLAGCDETSCLSQIAGALGTDELLASKVVRDGDTTVVELKRIDMTRTEVTHTANRRIKGGEGEEVLESLGPAVEEVFPGYPVREGMQRGVAPQVVERWNPPPLGRGPFLVAAGLAAGAFAVSGYFWWQQRGDENEYNRRAKSSTSEEQYGAALKQLQASAEENNRRARYAALTGGALVLTAGVLWLFTDWQGGPEVAVAPRRGGALAGVAFRFP